MTDIYKEKIKDYFDGIAGDYNSACDDNEAISVRRYIFSSRKKHVLNIFDIRGGRVLDIGCGPAVLTGYLLKKDCEVWGIDISNEMIRQASKRFNEMPFNQRAHFNAGDIEKLDFPDGHFNFVLCVGVLEYLKEDKAAFREIVRVLKPGGKVIISAPNMASPFVIFDRSLLIMFRAIIRLSVAMLNLFRLKVKIPPTRLSYRGDIVDKCYFPLRLNARLLNSGFRIDKSVYHVFRSSAVSAVAPQFSLFLAKKMEFLTNSPLRWIGVDYIVKAVKI